MHKAQVYQELEGGKLKPAEHRNREIYMYQAKISTVVNVFFSFKIYLFEELLIKTAEQTSKTVQN